MITMIKIIINLNLYYMVYFYFFGTVDGKLLKENTIVDSILLLSFIIH